MSEFYVRKIKTFFHRLDIDNDGAVTQKDVVDVAERFVNSGKLDAVRGADLRAKLIPTWEKYFKDPITGNPISEEACVAVFTKQFSDQEFCDDMRKVTIDLLQIYFNAVDANGDGTIQSKEYEHFFENHGIDKTFAAEAFQAIDTDGDGELSLEEFLAAGIEFFLGDDESSQTKYFWGPLV